MLFGQVSEVGKGKFNLKSDIIQATFFAGSSQALQAYSQAYFAMHDEWFDKGDFVGKEQNLMNGVVFGQTNMSNQSVRLMAWRLPMCTEYDQEQPFDVWFVYQRYLASESFYRCNYSQRLAYLVHQ